MHGVVCEEGAGAFADEDGRGAGGAAAGGDGGVFARDPVVDGGYGVEAKCCEESWVSERCRRSCMKRMCTYFR